jgi:hypothetical protein
MRKISSDGQSDFDSYKPRVRKPVAESAAAESAAAESAASELPPSVEAQQQTELRQAIESEQLTKSRFPRPIKKADRVVVPPPIPKGTPNSVRIAMMEDAKTRALVEANRSSIPVTAQAQTEAEIRQQLAIPATSQQQIKQSVELSSEIPALTQAAFQQQLTRVAGNAPSTYEAQIQSELRQQVIANASAAKTTRTPQPYTLSQGQLFNMPPDRVSQRSGAADFDYPEQVYEQVDVADRSRALQGDDYQNYLNEAVDRAAKAYGVAPENLTGERRASVQARASEQVLRGAPIVPRDPLLEPNVVDQGQQNSGGLLNAFRAGWEQQHMGGQYNPYVGGASGRNPSYARSYLVDKYMQARNHFDPEYDSNEPVYLYQDKSLAEKAAIEAGRIAGDITGAGTRKFLWNMHPEDFVNTYGKNRLEAITSIDPATRRTLAWGAAGALGVLSGNYNPLNFAEGGRAAGFQAVTPTEDDPRKSENAVMDYLVYRGMLGRSGRLLPWEEFHEERPEIDYDKYEAYKKYLSDPGVLGLVKGTLDGIDGPEARVMGYRITPEGALGAAAVLGAGMYFGRKQ